MTTRQPPRRLARLSRPNVVPVFEVGEFDGPVFVAMDVAAVSSAGDQAMLRLERRARGLED